MLIQSTEDTKIGCRIRIHKELDKLENGSQLNKMKFNRDM